MKRADLVRYLEKKFLYTNFIVLCLCFLNLSAAAQLTPVNKASVETTDKISFQIAVVQSSVYFGEDIRIKYKVENRSSKNIYLIKETPQQFDYDGVTILVEASLPSRNPHFQNEYSLIKIKKDDSFEGEYIIPSKLYKDVGIYPIGVGFAYVEESADLKETWKTGRTIEEKYFLSTIGKIVGIGDITVEVKSSAERR